MAETILNHKTLIGQVWATLVGVIGKTIEEVFKLPPGSVALCGPDGKPLRSDATIATLKKRWD